VRPITDKLFWKGAPKSLADLIPDLSQTHLFYLGDDDSIQEAIRPIRDEHPGNMEAIRAAGKELRQHFLVINYLGLKAEVCRRIRIPSRIRTVDSARRPGRGGPEALVAIADIPRRHKV
jgi:hypothetical protein